MFFLKSWREADVKFFIEGHSNFSKQCLIFNIKLPFKGTEFLPQIHILKSYIFLTWWRKPLIFQTIIIWSKMIDSLKYLRLPTLKCKDIGIRKSEFVKKNSIPLGWVLQQIFRIQNIFASNFYWETRENFANVLSLVFR